MAISFPMGRDAFIGTLRIQAMRLELRARQEVSGLADGSVLVDDLGPALWAGSVALAPMPFAQAGAALARIALLQGPGRSFNLWCPAQKGPASDPDGDIIAAVPLPVLDAVDSSGREIAIAGLPGGYVLSCGDLLSFAYGSNPTRIALHRLVSDSVVATAQGRATGIEVVPALRAGYSLGAAVHLKRAWCRAVIVPGSVTTGESRRGLTTGIGFSFLQTLR